MKTFLLGISICVAFAIAAPAQTFKSLVSFDGTDGTSPIGGPLVQGPNGILYGTTENGGAAGNGTVFAMTPAGKLTTLYSFCNPSCADGQEPRTGLALASGGTLYGTTFLGGAHENGTIFAITPAGKLKTLYSFCSLRNCADGNNPFASPVQASNGNFYGTTENGGAHNVGTVFEITPGGKLTTLYSFCSLANCADGSYPLAGLVLASDGMLYGSTEGGGANNSGTVFSITLTGSLNTLYSFCSQSGCADGESPAGTLVQASDGNLYGTTAEGGIVTGICGFGCGTFFSISPTGTLTTLYSFCSVLSCGDGMVPNGALIQATDGNFYGTTEYGGANCIPSSGCGTMFKVTPAGGLTTLYSFCPGSQCTDGSHPTVGLVQASNGRFYGTTFTGGVDGDGTVFVESTGLD